MYIQIEVDICRDYCYVEPPEDIEKWVAEIKNQEEDQIVFAIINGGNAGARIEIRKEFNKSYRGLILNVDKKTLGEIIDGLLLVKDRTDFNNS